MAVFMIKQEAAGENRDRSPTLESSTEIENTETTNASNVPENIPAAQEVAQATGKEVTVKIDGPVGRVFTDALNKVLASESLMMTATDAVVDTGEKEEDKEEEVDLQVYAWKSDQINTEDVVELTNEISKHEERTFIVAVEGTEVSSPMGILYGLNKVKNVEVVFSQEEAIHRVMKRVGK